MSIYTTSTGGILAGWANTGSIGTLVPGEISQLQVAAIFSTSTVYPKYIRDGSLPSGLTLNRDGTISGSADVNATTTNFSVDVRDPNNNLLIRGAFSININQTTSTEYTKIYCKPLLLQDKRNEFIDFIRNDKIFIPSLLYRPFDPNFGRQEELKIVLDFGIQRLYLNDYATILSKNAYKRPLSTGDIKVAIAKDATGKTTHEIIYVDIIDKHTTVDGISIPQAISYHNVLYYPPSIPNIRSRLSTSTSITSVQNPLFTQTVQTGAAVKLGYIPYVALCFTQPGKSATIKRKIADSGFKFNTFNFEIDRVVVQNSLDNQGAKYLLLGRNLRLA